MEHVPGQGVMPRRPGLEFTLGEEGTSGPYVIAPGYQKDGRNTTPLYALATLSIFVVAGVIAYAWWTAIDNWFRQEYPDGGDIKPRFVAATIMTVIALVIVYFVLKVKKL